MPGHPFSVVQQVTSADRPMSACCAIQSQYGALQVVGEALMPHLAPLSVSQMKLITIYVDRRQHQLRANATTTAP